MHFFFHSHDEEVIFYIAQFTCKFQNMIFNIHNAYSTTHLSLRVVVDQREGTGGGDWGRGWGRGGGMGVNSFVACIFQESDNL